MTHQILAVRGRCPMGCGATLFLASGGHVTCGRHACPDPVAVDKLLHGVVPASAAPVVGDDVPPLVIPADALEAIQSGIVGNESPSLRTDEAIEVDFDNPPADIERIGTYGGVPVFVENDGGVPHVETPETKTSPGGSRCPRIVAVDISRPGAIPRGVVLGDCTDCGRVHFQNAPRPVERRAPAPNTPGVSFQPGGV